MKDKEDRMQSEQLKPFNVRLPRDICEQMPKVKIRTGKKIQDFVRDALKSELRRAGLL